MGRGKNESSSKSAYPTEKNKDIKNQVFESTSTSRSEDKKSHSQRFYTKHVRSTSGAVHITRSPFVVLNPDTAKTHFLKLVERYEAEYKMQLADLSKRDLMFQVLDVMEKEHVLLCLKDDARQFMTYRFVVPDVLKLYLYKMLYPRIFDFRKEEELVAFSSAYIQQNFNVIYRQIEVLSYTLIYDAMIMATADVCEAEIQSMKNYKLTIDCGDAVKDLHEQLTTEFKVGNRREPRVGILELFLPSILFKAKHYENIYRNDAMTSKKVTSIFSAPVFYKGTRAEESRLGIPNAWREIKDLLEGCPDSFSFLLNAYFINQKTHLYDFRILQDNREFKTYLIDGIVSKHHIDSVIRENSKQLPKVEAEGLQLTSVHNSPNCIVDHLNGRDYEVLNFILTRTAKCFRDYYFRSGDKAVMPSRVIEIVQWLNQENSAERMRDIVPLVEITDIHNTDYLEVMREEMVTS